MLINRKILINFLKKSNNIIKNFYKKFYKTLKKFYKNLLKNLIKKWGHFDPQKYPIFLQKFLQKF